MFNFNTHVPAALAMASRQRSGGLLAALTTVSHRRVGTSLLAAVGFIVACASMPPQAMQKAPAPKAPAPKALAPAERMAILRRSQVWTPIDTSALDLKKGPAGAGSFAVGAEVKCEYVDRTLDGKTPKFECLLDIRRA